MSKQRQVQRAKHTEKERQEGEKVVKIIFWALLVLAIISFISLSMMQ